MSRYTGPKWRINRREGASVLGSNEKWRRRPTAPGMYPTGVKLTEYGTQLREKQKVKRMYGMTESQFRRFYALAQKSTGNTGTRFLQLLELRIDNVLYRLGLARTRAQARQLVTHGHVKLNGKKHDIPSAIMTAGAEIELDKDITEAEWFRQMRQELTGVKVPEWLNSYANGGKLEAEPTRAMMDPTIKERLIIEFYSKFNV